jgi:cobalt/nickel transport system permease protein
MGHDFLDRYSRGDTFFHRLPARLKIVATFALILTGLWVPLDYWPVHGCLACLIFAAQSVAQIPLAYLGHRLLLFLPFVVLMSIGLPLAESSAANWQWFAAVLVRSTLSFLAGLWLVNVTPFDQLLVGFRRLGMPQVLIAILAFMYRYIFVVFDEFDRMRQARLARSFGRRRGWQEWVTSAQLLGMLLIRSLDRAERVYGAMCARGWDGRVRTLNGSDPLVNG